jgi:hypothetical protein
LILKDPYFYGSYIFEKNVDLDISKIPLHFSSAIFLTALISFVFYFMFEAGLIKESITGKLNFNRLVNSGKSNFWKFVWFCIVSFFFLILLFLALIIPGIIFSVYWILAVFVYFDSKKNVIESLKTSFHMVKGNWWKIFGYILLLLIFSIIIGVVTSVISLPTLIKIYSLNSPASSLLICDFILNSISDFLSNLIIIPFSILFYKNIYLELKNKKNKRWQFS